MKLTIERMGYGADGIAHTDEGKTVFVAGGVVGDVVDAELTSDGPSFSRARATNIIEPSGMRVTPPCPFVGVCGGCPWGALGRETQLHAKEENLRSALQRIGHFTPEEINDLVQPIRYTKDAWGYRNKIELGVHSENGRLRLGMHGIDPDQIILDPGIGFGKTYEQNLAVIHHLEELNRFDLPILLGTSRKSVIGLTLDLPAEERMEGTLVTTVLAVEKGCSFVRVHDVRENVRAIRMARAILEAE